MNIALMSHTIAQHDAVSHALRDKYEAVKQHFGDKAKIKVYAINNEYDWPEWVAMKEPADLLYVDFKAHDVYIFEWAIYNDVIIFIRLIKALNPRAKVFIHFHNVSPIDLVEDELKPMILQSYDQFALFQLADKVWSTSEFNRQELLNYGLDADHIDILPPAVQFKQSQPLSVAELVQLKQGDVVNILYVGRFVTLKNIMLLIKAIEYLVSYGVNRIKLSLVGASRFSRDAYLDEIYQAIDDAELQSYIEVAVNVSEDELLNYFKQSCIFITASQHEGFCVPIVEALYYGCYPIAFHHSNLPYIINGLGVTVESNNQRAFFEALMATVKVFLVARPRSEVQLPVVLDDDEINLSYPAFIQQATQYAVSFSRESCCKRFIDLLGYAE